MTTYENILNKLDEIIQQTLGEGYRSLPYVFDITKNNCKGNFKRYGIIPGGMESAEFANAKANIRHIFSILLVNNYVNTAHSDERLRSTLQDLYTKADELIISVISRLENYSKEVYSVTYLGTDLPEVYDTESVLVLRFNFAISYSKTIF